MTKENVRMGSLWTPDRKWSPGRVATPARTLTGSRLFSRRTDILFSGRPSVSGPHMLAWRRKRRSAESAMRRKWDARSSAELPGTAPGPLELHEP